MERLVRSCYRQGGYKFAKRSEEIAREYGIDRIARLASNENPEPPSPVTLAAGETALQQVNRYPDERVDILTSALRKYYGDYRFVTGAGMDGVIETLFRTLVEPGETVAISTPTFSFYGLAAQAQGAKVVTVPRKKDFSIDTDALVRAGKNAKVVVLCSPNNPTGNSTPVGDVEKVLAGIECLLFLDNAYVEFSDCDYLPLLEKYENLVIGRTFSKVHSLAGLRVGYSFVPAWLEPFYLRAATPFAVNSVSAATAAAALSDTGHAERYIAKVKKWRNEVSTRVKYPTLPSGANFVMVDVSPRTGQATVDLLAAKGVLVRSCGSFPGLPDHYIRVSCGDDWENELFIREINAV